jgi:predicted nucleotidyltransferase
MPTSGFNGILQCLNDCGAKYLIVGAYVVMRYTEPRATKDLDLWIDNTPQNARRVFDDLAKFGAPLAGIVPADLEKREMVLQIGVAPVRVDVLTSLPGLEFRDAWDHRDTVQWEGVQTHFISKADLIRAKQAAGRPSDRQDLRRLAGKKK